MQEAHDDISARVAILKAVAGCIDVIVTRCIKICQPSILPLRLDAVDGDKSPLAVFFNERQAVAIVAASIFNQDIMGALPQGLADAVGIHTLSHGDRDHAAYAVHLKS